MSIYFFRNRFSLIDLLLINTLNFKNFGLGEKFMNNSKIGLILTILFIFTFACTSNEQVVTNPANDANQIANITTVPSPDATIVELADGKDLYKENCARCHQDDGTGGKVTIDGETIKPDNLTTAKMKKEPDSEYIEHITEGIPDEGMPAFKGRLTDEEMKEIVKYIRKDLQKN